MILEFFMPMVPPTVTAQDQDIHVVRSAKSKSGHRPVFVDSPELKAATSKIEAHLAGHVPAVPLKAPIRLVTKWCWPCEGTSHADGEWYTDKPDTHNVVKMPVDVMERLGFFANDKHIASEVIEKFWAHVPGIYVRLEEIS
ncbi:MAG: RusA family crossover junction endodeoxyribonuclease [Coriobacteriia bacterium]